MCCMGTHGDQVQQPILAGERKKPFRILRVSLWHVDVHLREEGCVVLRPESGCWVVPCGDKFYLFPGRFLSPNVSTLFGSKA